MFSSYCRMFVRFATVSVAALGAISISVCWCGSKRETASCPKVYVANDKFDLGVVRPFETREVAFSIENQGLRRLILNEIGCGCGSPIRPAIVVLPGNTEIVPVLLETSGDLEKIEKKVSFATNDTLHPRIDLTVLAQVTDL